jgi:hypothetical protein
MQWRHPPHAVPPLHSPSPRGTSGMTTKKRKIGVLALPIMALAWPGAVAAQEEDYRTIVMIMRACTTIEDVLARAACYDRNVRAPESGAQAATSAPAAPARPPRSSAAAPASIGSESLPRARSQVEEPQEAELQVARSSSRQPGIYVLTFDDGAEWQFVEPAPAAYDAPRAGSKVKITRGALGGYLMRYAEQPAIRIKRLR